MFKAKDVLSSLEQIISPEKITTDTLALELTNVISDKGNICLEKTDIECVLKNSSECNYNILIQTSNNKTTYKDILDDKITNDIKTIILIIKHNGNFSLFEISELMDDIKENLPNSDIELLIGDYIDKNTNEIKVTTLILK